MADEVDSGPYTIVNKVEAPDGSRLAVTFNQKGSPLPVLPLNPNSANDSQIWIVGSLLGGLKTISPARDDNLRAEPVNGDYVVPNTDRYNWWIDGGLNEVVIYDRDRTKVWGISDADPGAPVILGPFNPENEKQKWELIPVNAA